jgi:pseudaminic acid biosynthesis-associated methylase
VNLIKKNSEQVDLWKGEFGREYTDRNEQTLQEMEAEYVKRFGKSRTEINTIFLEDLDRSLKILEIGCGIGNQLICLQKMGFTSLFGIDIQTYAIEKAKARTENISFFQGKAEVLPFEDGDFDLVYTSGVLIHIAPDNIYNVLKEIYRCSNQFIFGYEYFAEEWTSVENYRNEKNALWKTNYAKLYLNNFKDLVLVKEERYPYISNKNLVDTFFLLKKV